MDASMRKGLVFITISSLSYAFVIIITKAGLNQGLESSSFTFLTMAFALLVLLPYYFSKKREVINQYDYIQFLFIGVLASGIAHLFFFFGQSYTSAINAGFIAKLTTLFTAFFAFFLVCERLQRIDWIAIAISFVGVYLISTRGSFEPQLGDSLILISSIFLGFSNAYAKRLMKNHSSRTIVVWRTIFGIPLLFLFSIFFSRNPFSALSFIVLLNGLFMGITVMFLYKSIEVIGPSLSSTLFFISPIFSTILAVIILKEILVSSQIIGGIIILLGTFLIAKRFHV